MSVLLWAIKQPRVTQVGRAHPPATKGAAAAGSNVELSVLPSQTPLPMSTSPQWAGRCDGWVLRQCGTWLTSALRESTGYIHWPLQASATGNCKAQRSSWPLQKTHLVLHWCLPDVDTAGWPYGRGRKESVTGLFLRDLMRESRGKIVGLFCG